MDSKFSEFSPRCAYFFGFKRFSKSDQKVNEMVKMEATVTSGVTNWYIMFLFHKYWMWEMPVGGKNVIIFVKFRFFAFKVFQAPPTERLYPPPRTPLGGQQVGFAPNYDGTRKRNGNFKNLTRRQVGGVFRKPTPKFLRSPSEKPRFL